MTYTLPAEPYGVGPVGSGANNHHFIVNSNGDPMLTPEFGSCTVELRLLNNVQFNPGVGPTSPDQGLVQAALDALADLVEDWAGAGSSSATVTHYWANLPVENSE